MSTARRLPSGENCGLLQFEGIARSGFVCTLAVHPDDRRLLQFERSGEIRQRSARRHGKLRSASASARGDSLYHRKPLTDDFKTLDIEWNRKQRRIVQ
jgi:hypothetical protein